MYYRHLVDWSRIVCSSHRSFMRQQANFSPCLSTMVLYIVLQSVMVSGGCTVTTAASQPHFWTKSRQFDSHKSSIPLSLSGLWAASREANWLPTVHTVLHSHLSDSMNPNFTMWVHISQPMILKNQHRHTLTFSQRRGKMRDSNIWWPCKRKDMIWHWQLFFLHGNKMKSRSHYHHQVHPIKRRSLFYDLSRSKMQSWI